MFVDEEVAVTVDVDDAAASARDGDVVRLP